MTEIIQSIHPQWVKEIFAGLKGRELRKSKPSSPDVKYPIKVYMYETKDKCGAGAVVGEYTCRGISSTNSPEIAQIMSRVPLAEVSEYMGSGRLHCWDISEVKRYTEPIPLNEFTNGKAPQSWCYLRR